MDSDGEPPGSVCCGPPAEVACLSAREPRVDAAGIRLIGEGFDGDAAGAAVCSEIERAGAAGGEEVFESSAAEAAIEGVVAPDLIALRLEDGGEGI